MRKCQPDHTNKPYFKYFVKSYLNSKVIVTRSRLSKLSHCRTFCAKSYRYCDTQTKLWKCMTGRFSKVLTWLFNESMDKLIHSWEHMLTVLTTGRWGAEHGLSIHSSCNTIDNPCPVSSDDWNCVRLIEWNAEPNQLVSGFSTRYQYRELNIRPLFKYEQIDL